MAKMMFQQQSTNRLRYFLATTPPAEVFGRPANFFGSLLVGMVVMLLPDAVLHIKLIVLSGRTGIKTNRQLIFLYRRLFKKEMTAFPCNRKSKKNYRKSFQTNRRLIKNNRRCFPIHWELEKKLQGGFFSQQGTQNL